MTPNAPVASMGLVLRRRYFGQKVGSRESWLGLIRTRALHLRHPTAVFIAVALIRHADILKISRGRLIRDIRYRYRCGYGTAALALTLAHREVA